MSVVGIEDLPVGLGVDTSPTGFAVSIAAASGPVIVDVQVPEWGDTVTEVGIADAMGLCLSMALVLTDVSRRVPGFDVTHAHILDRGASLMMIDGMSRHGRAAEPVRTAPISTFPNDRSATCIV